MTAIKLDDKDKCTIALKYYETARQELISRVGLRNQILSWYLAAIGTLLGLTLRSGGDKNVLLVLPIVTLGVSCIIVQQNNLIGCLGKYCANEIGPIISNNELVQWDTSKSLNNYCMHGFTHLTSGHILIIIPPAFVTLILTYESSFAFFTPITIIWWFNLICTYIGLYNLYE